MNSPRTSRNKRLGIIVGACVTLVVVWFFAPRVLDTAAEFVFRPVLGVQEWVRSLGANAPAYFTERSALLQRIAELEKQQAEERGSMAGIARLQEENQTLRSLLGSPEEPRIAAGVIGRPTVTPYDVLVIDKGAHDGVLIDTPVFTGIDQVIGLVTTVFEHTSVVSLISTPGVASTVYVIGPDIYTTAEGMGGGVIKISVPQGVILSVGDLVVIPSFDAGVYGAISVVESIPSEPEQRGYVTLEAPLQSLRYVSVGKTPLTPMSFEEARESIARVKASLVVVPVPEGVLIDVDQASSSATSTQPRATSTSSTP